ITGVDVVAAHLARNQREPDTRKIYLTLKAGAAAAPVEPLSLLEFDFHQSGDACLVNSNSFPAQKVTIRYKVRAPIRPIPVDPSLTEQRTLLASGPMEDDINEAIARDVCTLLESDPAQREQAIVYVQNK